jgi:predicted tellurium resistance membrane protein TerC
MERNSHCAHAGSRLDRWAIGLSGLCLAHCLGTAVVLAVLASAAGPLLDPRIHEVGLGLAILLAAIALGRGVTLHHRVAPLLIGACGLLLMSGGLFVPHGPAELALTISGVTLLAGAHLANRRACSVG